MIYRAPGESAVTHTTCKIRNFVGNFNFKHRERQPAKKIWRDEKQTLPDQKSARTRKELSRIVRSDSKMKTDLRESISENFGYWFPYYERSILTYVSPNLKYLANAHRSWSTIPGFRDC